MISRLLLIAVLAFLLAGCGRKGPLIPPEAMVPAAIGDLRTAQLGDLFMISWSQPSREQSGRPLKELAGFRLYRRDVLPPREDCEECPTAYILLRDVDPEFLQDVVRSGSFYSYTDSGLVNGKTYQYKIVSFKNDATESKQSNLARRKKVPPPAPPSGVKAIAAPTEIVISWDPLPAPANGTIVGYLVYRRSGSGPLVPVTGKPRTEPNYLDIGLERSVTYGYRIRTVARIDGETVESELSAEIAERLAEPD